MVSAFILQAVSLQCAKERGWMGVDQCRIHGATSVYKKLAQQDTVFVAVVKLYAFVVGGR